LAASILYNLCEKPGITDMFKKPFIVLIIAGLYLTCCNKDFSPIGAEQRQPMRPLTPSEKSLVKSAEAFGLELFKAVEEEDQNKDIFISPLSVSMALGMTLNGADSGTYQAMRQTLQFADLSNEDINQSYRSLIKLVLAADPKVMMEIANSIWHRDDIPVESSFLETNRTFFDATIMPMNFRDPATVTAINNWVNDKTHGKITEVIDSIDPLTLMFLINAIYFKGTWQYEFDKEKTADASFYLMDGSTDNCQMMQLEADLSYYSDDQVQIVDLPYGDGAFSMTIFLPKNSENLNPLIMNLDKNQWEYYINRLTTSPVMLEMPKFKLEYKLIMNSILSQMGMAIAFDPDHADFSRINQQLPLHISSVLHKTFVQVDEEGTEAAAVTVVTIGLTSVGPHGNHMRVDHPFVFALRERQSGTLLFMGKILQPQWSD
jgi:serine protease inhibitor